MTVSIIAAMDRNRLIGSRNQLPWHLPADLAHFKSVTMGKPLIMGRKTYESIGRPLPGRLNIVMSRNADLAVDGVEQARDLEAALQIASREGKDEVMIIGGANIYQQALPVADRMYLTIVQAEYVGDAWFPEYDPAEWRLQARSEHYADAKNEVDYSFEVYDRVK